MEGGGASVASLAARLRDVSVCRDVLRSRECDAGRFLPGVRVAGETFSVNVESVSLVFVRIGDRGMSTVISGRDGIAVSSSRTGAVSKDEYAIVNGQCIRNND
jgi:DNA-binding transcriptional regulator YhcF (GntR family)